MRRDALVCSLDTQIITMCRHHFVRCIHSAPPEFLKKFSMRAPDKFRLKLSHVVVEHDNAPRAIVGQKGANGIKLVPRPILINDPATWVFEGPEHVVDVHVDALGQAR